MGTLAEAMKAYTGATHKKGARRTRIWPFRALRDHPRRTRGAPRHGKNAQRRGSEHYRGEAQQNIAPRRGSEQVFERTQFSLSEGIEVAGVIINRE